MKKTKFQILVSSVALFALSQSAFSAGMAELEPFRGEYLLKSSGSSGSCPSHVNVRVEETQAGTSVHGEFNDPHQAGYLFLIPQAGESRTYFQDGNNEGGEKGWNRIKSSFDPSKMEISYETDFAGVVIAVIPTILRIKTVVRLEEGNSVLVYKSSRNLSTQTCRFERKLQDAN